MSFASDVLAAIARLSSFYNGNTYNPTTNPGGMRNGGHRLNFAPSLQDHALVAAAVATEATAAAGSATAASSSASAAAGSASAAATAKTAAESAQAAAEAAAAGITWKVSVKAASTANLTLSGTQTVDGVALVANDRVLVKDQSTAANNGIYLVQAGAWTRSADANIWTELVGAAVIVEQGTVNADVIFICTSNSGGTLGTTAVTFSRITLASLAGQISASQIPSGLITSDKLAGGVGLPSGMVSPYAGATAPTGWQLCYGQAISRTSYAALFSAIGTVYGIGDGSTTFNLPDLRGFVVAGQDDMGGVSANRLTGLSGGIDGDTLGATGGEEAHVLTIAEMPNHTHNISTGGNLSLTGGAASANTGAATAVTAAAGSGGAHNNVQPTIVLNYIIKE